jgi:hypothetical protein
MKGRHEGRPQRWLGLWLGTTAICCVLAVACLVLAYRMGDSLQDQRRPLAEALGRFGLRFVIFALVVGLSGLLIWVRDRREGRK